MKQVTENPDYNISLYSLRELEIMKIRHEAGRNKYSYAGPFTLDEINKELHKRSNNEL